jgi:hypothetical protein
VALTAALLACARAGEALAQHTGDAKETQATPRPAATGNPRDANPPRAAEEAWSEIVLPDGTRARVPTRKLPSHAQANVRPSPERRREPPRAPAEQAAPAEARSESRRGSPPGRDDTAGRRNDDDDARRDDDAARRTERELAAEVTRLRGIVDELESMRSAAAVSPAARPAPAPDRRSWLTAESAAAGIAALVIGFLVGAAVQRERARRARSLRF